MCDKVVVSKIVCVTKLWVKDCVCDKVVRDKLCVTKLCMTKLCVKVVV